MTNHDEKAVADAEQRLATLEHVVADLVLAKVQDDTLDDEQPVTAAYRAPVTAAKKPKGVPKGGFDSHHDWHDPGSGEFAHPGVDTAKALIEEAFKKAIDHAKGNPDGVWLKTKDKYLSRIGVGKGEAVKVKYLDETHGVIDVIKGGKHTDRKVPWSRFDDTLPDETVKRIDAPTFTGNVTATKAGKGVAAATRIQGLGNAGGFVEVNDSYLNKFGISKGDVITARYLDDGHAIITDKSGTERTVAWARFTDRIPTENGDGTFSFTKPTPLPTPKIPESAPATGKKIPDAAKPFPQGPVTEPIQLSMARVGTHLVNATEPSYYYVKQADGTWLWHDADGTPGIASIDASEFEIKGSHDWSFKHPDDGPSIVDFTGTKKDDTQTALDSLPVGTVLTPADGNTLNLDHGITYTKVDSGEWMVSGGTSDTSKAQNGMLFDGGPGLGDTGPWNITPPSDTPSVETPGDGHAWTPDELGNMTTTELQSKVKVGDTMPAHDAASMLPIGSKVSFSAGSSPYTVGDYTLTHNDSGGALNYQELQTIEPPVTVDSLPTSEPDFEALLPEKPTGPKIGDNVSWADVPVGATAHIGTNSYIKKPNGGAQSPEGHDVGDGTPESLYWTGEFKITALPQESAENTHAPTRVEDHYVAKVGDKIDGSQISYLPDGATIANDGYSMTPTWTKTAEGMVHKSGGDPIGTDQFIQAGTFTVTGLPSSVPSADGSVVIPENVGAAKGTSLLDSLPIGSTSPSSLHDSEWEKTGPNEFTLHSPDGDVDVVDNVGFLNDHVNEVKFTPPEGYESGPVVGDEVNEVDIPSLPVGTTIVDKTSDDVNIGTFTKLADGWHGNTSNDSVSAKAVFGNDWTPTAGIGKWEIAEHPAPPGDVHGDTEITGSHTTKTNALDALEPGAVVGHEPGDPSWTKNNDGTWENLDTGDSFSASEIAHFDTLYVTDADIADHVDATTQDESSDGFSVGDHFEAHDPDVVHKLDALPVGAVLKQIAGSDAGEVWTKSIGYTNGSSLWDNQNGIKSNSSVNLTTFPNSSFSVLQTGPDTDTAGLKAGDAFSYSDAGLQAKLDALPIGSQVQTTSNGFDLGKVWTKSGTLGDGQGLWKSDGATEKGSSGFTVGGGTYSVLHTMPSQSPEEPAAPQVEPVTAPTMGLPSLDGSTDGWKKVGGQGGTNPGAMFEQTATSDRYYVKNTKSADHRTQELAANLLYEKAGVRVPKTVIDPDSQTLIGSQVENGKILGTNGSKASLDKLRDDMVVDAWLSNWDVVGHDGDNVKIVDGTPVRIDSGGSLGYRAQGTPKGTAFGDEVGELQTLRGIGVTNKSAAQKIFADTTNGQMTEGAQKVAAVSPDDIRAIVKASGGKDSLADTIIARRTYIINKLLDGHDPLTDDGKPMYPAASNADFDTYTMLAYEVSNLLDAQPTGTTLMPSWSDSPSDLWTKQPSGMWGLPGGREYTFNPSMEIPSPAPPVLAGPTKINTDDYADASLNDLLKSIPVGATLTDPGGGHTSYTKIGDTEWQWDGHPDTVSSDNFGGTGTWDVVYPGAPSAGPKGGSSLEAGDSITTSQFDSLPEGSTIVHDQGTPWVKVPTGWQNTKNGEIVPPTDLANDPWWTVGSLPDEVPAASIPEATTTFNVGNTVTGHTADLPVGTILKIHGNAPGPDNRYSITADGVLSPTGKTIPHEFLEPIPFDIEALPNTATPGYIVGDPVTGHTADLPIGATVKIHGNVDDNLYVVTDGGLVSPKTGKLIPHEMIDAIPFDVASLPNDESVPVGDAVPHGEEGNAALNALPYGAQITDTYGGMVYTKDTDGTWTSADDSSFTASAFTYDTSKFVITNPGSSSTFHVDDVVSASQLASLPVGTEFSSSIENGGMPGAPMFVKNKGGYASYIGGSNNSPLTDFKGTFAITKIPPPRDTPVAGDELPATKVGDPVPTDDAASFLDGLPAWTVITAPTTDMTYKSFTKNPNGMWANDDGTSSSASSQFAMSNAEWSIAKLPGGESTWSPLPVGTKVTTSEEFAKAPAGTWFEYGNEPGLESHYMQILPDGTYQAYTVGGDETVSGPVTPQAVIPNLTVVDPPAFTTSSDPTTANVQPTITTLTADKLDSLSVGTKITSPNPQTSDLTKQLDGTWSSVPGGTAWTSHDVASSGTLQKWQVSQPQIGDTVASSGMGGLPDGTQFKNKNYPDGGTWMIQGDHAVGVYGDGTTSSEHYDFGDLNGIYAISALPTTTQADDTPPSPSSVPTLSSYYSKSNVYPVAGTAITNLSKEDAVADPNVSTPDVLKAAGIKGVSGYLDKNGHLQGKSSKLTGAKITVPPDRVIGSYKGKLLILPEDGIVKGDGKEIHALPPGSTFERLDAKGEVIQKLTVNADGTINATSDKTFLAFTDRAKVSAFNKAGTYHVTSIGTSVAPSEPALPKVGDPLPTSSPVMSTTKYLDAVPAGTTIAGSSGIGYVKQADGTWQAGTGPKHTSSEFDHPNSAFHFTAVGDAAVPTAAPATNAPTAPPTAGTPLDTHQALLDAPIGTMMAESDTPGAPYFKKITATTWKYNLNGHWYDTTYQSDKLGLGYHVIGADAEPTPTNGVGSYIGPPTQPAAIDALDAFPTGAKINGGGPTYTKLADGTWKAEGVGTLPSSTLAGPVVNGDWHVESLPSTDGQVISPPDAATSLAQKYPPAVMGLKVSQLAKENGVADVKEHTPNNLAAAGVQNVVGYFDDNGLLQGKSSAKTGEKVVVPADHVVGSFGNKLVVIPQSGDIASKSKQLQMLPVGSTFTMTSKTGVISKYEVVSPGMIHRTDAPYEVKPTTWNALPKSAKGLHVDQIGAGGGTTAAVSSVVEVPSVVPDNVKGQSVGKVAAQKILTDQGATHVTGWVNATKLEQEDSSISIHPEKPSAGNYVQQSVPVDQIVNTTKAGKFSFSPPPKPFEPGKTSSKLTVAKTGSKDPAVSGVPFSYVTPNDNIVSSKRFQSVKAKAQAILNNTGAHSGGIHSIISSWQGSSSDVRLGSRAILDGDNPVPVTKGPEYMAQGAAMLQMLNDSPTINTKLYRGGRMYSTDVNNLIETSKAQGIVDLPIGPFTHKKSFGLQNANSPIGGHTSGKEARVVIVMDAGAKGIDFQANPWTTGSMTSEQEVATGGRVRVKKVWDSGGVYYVQVEQLSTANLGLTSPSIPTIKPTSPNAPVGYTVPAPGAANVVSYSGGWGSVPVGATVTPSWGAAMTYTKLPDGSAMASDGSTLPGDSLSTNSAWSGGTFTGSAPAAAGADGGGVDVG